MEQSFNSCAQYHEIQHLLIALDQLGKDFGHNRDTYYTLGRHLGYKDSSLLKLNLKKTLFHGYYVIQLLNHLLLTFQNLCLH